MRRPVFSLFLAALMVAGPLPAPAGRIATIVGRILDTDGGLPVPNAAVELDRGGVQVATTTTDSNGVYRFENEPQGVYSISIVASGYDVTHASNVALSEDGTLDLQTAIHRTSASLQTIANVNAGRNASLQTTTTINAHVDPSILQNQNYLRSGDVLGTVPFVNASTSSSLGDDLSLSIRGYSSSETATLLDGHPIGPIGAKGNGFDYQISPFWGVNSIDVIFGSGATGLYGASTIAGAVNFQTISPTRTPVSTFIQGVGNNGRLMTGLQYTNTLGKLGVAMAYGASGTDGELGPPQQTTQNANLTSDSNGYPDITPANIAANTYSVTGAYLMRNAVAKLTYQFDSKTSALFTVYNATSWDDKSGNGDTDYNPSPYVLYNTNNTLAGNNNQSTINGPGQTILPNINGGAQVTCTGSVAVLVPSAPGYACYSPQQYAATFAGPAGGGPERWQDMRNQDYHAQISRQIGTGTLIFDGFSDSYSQDQSKGVGGPYPTDRFYTHGFLASDEYTAPKNDVSFGLYLQHQEHVIESDSISQGTFDLTSSSYFIRDAYTPTLRFSTFADLWLQHSNTTNSTNFDPRISLVYRPTSKDVVRLTGGHSYSEPDPSLLYGPFSYGAPQSLNPICGSGDLNSIGSGNDPNLKPETADDLELAYGHRVSQRTVIQADVYSSIEAGPLLGGTFPLSIVPPGQLPSQAMIAQYLQRIDQFCGPGHTESDLGVSTTFNAGSARYSGVSLDATVGVARDVTANGNYAIQSAVYNGISNSILQNNATLVNGSQFYGIPLRTANLGFAYRNGAGLAAGIDGHYIGGPSNGFNRGPYMYANANISKTTGHITVNIGVFNLFNSIAQQYGYVGLGVFKPENSFGTDQNAFDQGSEEFGLPYRQIWLTVRFNM